MDLRAVAKLVALKAGDSEDLEALLETYGVRLGFREKATLAELLSSDFEVVYDAVRDKFLLRRSKPAGGPTG